MKFSAIETSSYSEMVDKSSCSTPLTPMYHSSPRYQYSAFCDLRFYIPSLFNFTNTVVYSNGYTCEIITIKSTKT